MKEPQVCGTTRQTKRYKRKYLLVFPVFIICISCYFSPDVTEDLVRARLLHSHLSQEIPPPTFVSVTPSAYGELTVSWDAVSGADGYYIYYSTSPGLAAETSSRLNQNQGTSLKHPGLIIGTNYYYAISAYNSQTTSPLSAEISAKAVASAGFSPVVTLSNPGELAITWGSIPTAAFYTVYWSTTPGVTISSNKITPASSPAIHGPLISNQAYYYRVTYTENGIESQLSPEASAIAYTVPAIPASVSVTKVSQTSLMISWPPTMDALLYEVYRSTSAGSVGVSLGYTPVTSVVSAGLIPGSTYYFQVRAYAGPFSSGLSVQTSSIAGAICGDGLVELAETCDSGGIDTAACNGGSCQLSICGDGYLNTAAGEFCDDGNLINGDGCSSICD